MRRIDSLDYMRIISCMFVIGIHVIWLLKPDDSGYSNEWLYHITHHIVRIGLPSFFILSSVGLTSKNHKINLKDYYFKRLIQLGPAFVFWSIFYYQFNNDYFHFPEIITTIPRALFSSMTTPQHYHLWYMYSIIGLILLTPFLKQFLDSLTYKELTNLIVICIVTKIITQFKIFNIGNLYFGSWVIYYLIGYYLLQPDSSKFLLHTIALGTISFILAVFINKYFANSVFATDLFDLSPFMIFQTSGFFAFWLWVDKKFNIRLPKMLSILPRLTFGIYLSHPYIMGIVTNKIWFLRHGLFGNMPIMFFLTVISMTFFTCAIVSLLFEYLFKLVEITYKSAYNKQKRKI